MKHTDYKIEGGMLKGPSGSWPMSSIATAYKTTGGKLSLKKFSLGMAGALGAAAAAAVSPLAPALVFIPTIGYMTHQTKRVMISFQGVETEIESVIYFPGMWGEEAADKECDALVALIQRGIP